ncbi:MAG: NAD(P)H-dependent oxidoreductase subunit E [Firmicutes bacterium]|jgi:NADH-quinone oxidoreductase subunit F|nr:NAD(P)H-dependent oxidoreductase subunit E [Bacillota bacterium]
MDKLEETARSAQDKLNAAAYRILVCKGTGCLANGAHEVYEALVKALPSAMPGSVELSDDGGHHHAGSVSQTGCHGLGQEGPLVTVRFNCPQRDEILYCRVKPEDVPKLVEQTIVKGGVVDRLLPVNPETGRPCGKSSEISFYNRQKRLALADCGHLNPESIDEYVANGGYKTFQHVTTHMSPRQVCDEVVASGLRGRGGAGSRQARSGWRC